MATKTFKVALSLDNPRIIQSGITVQSFDKQSVKISIALTKDSQTYQIPIGATIRISLLKLSNQAQKIIVDVPNDNRESIDWIVPDYLDGYHGVVRCGVYLLHGTESVDLGYFTILSNVSDIDKMAEEFTDNVFGGWEAIEEELRELNITIAQTKLDLAADMTQVDNTIASINAKNTQVNTLHSDFTADVATKQADVTSKYNAFDTSVTQSGQTIDEILGLADDVQQVSTQVAEKVQNFTVKNEVANGDFKDGLNSWLMSSSVGNVSQNEIEIKSDGTVTYGRLSNFNNVLIEKDSQIYVGVYIKNDSDSLTQVFIRNNQSTPLQYIVNKKIVEENYAFVSGVVKTTEKYDLGVRLYISVDYGSVANANNKKFNIKKPLLINMSEVFGVGNEPTKEEMDRLVAMVPNQWWDGELDLTQQQYVNWLLSFIREKANKTQEAWITPTLLNGWLEESGYQVGYYKDSTGIVRIRGRIKQGALAQTIFTLPVGYRPSSHISLPAVASGGTLAFLQITNIGQVQFLTGNNTYICLDSAQFKTEV